jgi:hypothetical protein
MPKQQFAALSAAGTCTVGGTVSSGNSLQAQVGGGDQIATLEISGTFTTPAGTIQGSTDGTNFQNISAVRLDTYAIEQTPTLTNSTTRQWIIPMIGALAAVRFNLTAIATGTVNCQLNTGSGTVPNILLASALSGNQAISGTMTITSTSASALTVGANGATNPVIQINANTSSQATGIQVTGAAAAGGVAIAVISSGTNENGTIDAKGSGTLTLNGVGGTGAVQIGGAASGANATGLTITPNSAASGLAIAVVSTGAAENLTINAKGTGTITLGSVSTGIVSIATNLTMTDAKNIAVGTATGTKIGTATTQKLGFFNAAPVVQPVGGGGSVATGAAGSTTTVFLNTTFVSGTGASAYTIADIVGALKAVGLLAA